MIKISRKLLVGLIGLGLITIGFLATALSPALAGQYTVFVGAISGMCGLFMVSNVGSQFVDRKGATEIHVAQVKNGQTPSELPVNPPTP